MTTDSAVASLQADLTALRAENKELTERLNELEAIAEASRPPEKFNPYLAHMVSQEEEEDE